MTSSIFSTKASSSSRTLRYSHASSQRTAWTQLAVQGLTWYSPLLQAYTGLKTLYLESNAIADIEGLEALTNLRCLYLGKNMIHQAAGLETLTQLESLDLSDNDIHCIEGLKSLNKLKFLSLAGQSCDAQCLMCDA